MTYETTVSKVKQILSQDYQTSAEKSAEMVSLCDQLSETLSSDTSEDKDFYIKFAQILRLFMNCEFFFLNNKFDKSLSNFEKLRESILKTQSDYAEFYTQWQYDLDRLLLRIDARIQNHYAAAIRNRLRYRHADFLHCRNSSCL